MDNSCLPVRIVPREQAVFWLDNDGCWRNRHGKFQNPKIIARFHACIRKDDHGYYLTQDHPHFREKVYFPYEDTALFVVDIQSRDEDLILVLNTGRRIPLPPDRLFIHSDHLYLNLDEDRVKFSERALVSLAKHMQFEDDTGRAWIHYQGRSRRIPADDLR